MFVGRERELKELEDLYREASFQCAIVWGRRRVGKTALLSQFVKGKEAVFYTALETSPRENLENFSRAALATESNVGAPVFPDWNAALDYIGRRAQSKRLILVIDEYPYLAQSYPPISSLLQSLIDGTFKKGRLFLILCGSSMSFMENQVLGYQSPLYGRRTAQFKLEPLSFSETARFYSRFSAENLANVYGITGGVPLYLEQIDDARGLKENVIRSFLKPSAYLFEEPINLLKQEVRDPANYNAIIKAIADGSTRLSEIAGKVGLETSACAVYLKNLIDLGIVRKEQPIGSSSSRKGLYAISDQLFRFWYRFIPPHMSMIQNGLHEQVWERIEALLPQYMGYVFEEICRQYLWQENARGDLPLRFTELGRWWGTDPARKVEAEIDILAIGDGNKALFCECKWTSADVDLPVLETLIERSRLLPYPEKRYVLFSKRGFTKRCRDVAAKRGDLRLIQYKDMLERSS